jgi:hypothetical protein
VTANPAVAYTVNVTEPWTRQPRESEVQHAWFLLYRDSAYPQGPSGKFEPRSLRQVAADLGYPYVTVQSWADSFAWADRAGAYDAYVTSRRDEAALSEADRTTALHGAQVRRLSRFVDKELAKAEAVGESPVPYFTKPRDLLVAMELSIKLQRLINEQATSIVRVDDDLDLSQLTDEELELQEKLREKARKKK